MGNIKKTALILSSDSVNMLIRGWWRPSAWSKITLKALLLYSFCIYNNLVPLPFHFYTFLKLQLNCEFAISQFSGPPLTIPRVTCRLWKSHSSKSSTVLVAPMVAKTGKNNNLLIVKVGRREEKRNKKEKRGSSGGL